jgi:hypothetical protein
VKTVVIQSFRTHAVPSWISRCLASVEAWAALRGYDYRLTDDSVFALCGDAYLARVGDNKRSITNLARLELIKGALADGYDYALWVDADVLVFCAEQLVAPFTQRICFAQEVWLNPAGGGWQVKLTLNNSVVHCPRGDLDLDFIIQATRHRALHHPVQHNFLVGVELIRGLHQFLNFPLLRHFGIFSNHVVLALAEGRLDVVALQAKYQKGPVFAVNLCASDDYAPVVSEAQAHAAIDLLEASRGEVINSRLPPSPAP